MLVLCHYVSIYYTNSQCSMGVLIYQVTVAVCFALILSRYVCNDVFQMLSKLCINMN